MIRVFRNPCVGQLNIFEARRDAIEGQRQILGQRVAPFS